MGSRRLLVWFAVGVAAAVVLAEVTARVAEASGPPALRYYDAATQLKVEQMERHGEAEVVFAGTSMVWQGLVPEVFTDADPQGRSAYNAGLAGGVPVVVEPWLLEEVVPRLHPGVVVWGLSSMDFATAYGADNLDRYRDALATRTGTLAAVEQAASDVSALVRYRSILRRPSALAGTERDRIETDFAEAAAVLGDDGERLDFTVDTGADRAGQVQARLLDYRVDPADVEAVIRTVRALEDRGVAVVLAEMPVPGRYVALHPGGAGDTARAHEAISALADVLGIPYVDLRYGFTDADFVDFTHLDRPGTGALTRSLAAALAGTAVPRPEEPETPGGGTAPATTTTAPVPGLPLDSLLASANRSINVFDHLYHHLLGGGEILAPEYWTSSQQAGKYGDMANAVPGGGFDVVMVGSSLVVNGFDPGLFAEADGRPAFNAGLAALSAEQLAFWLPDVVRLADPGVVVYGLAPRDVRVLNRVQGACTDTVEDWEFSEELRRTAFGPVEALSGVGWENLLFGDPVRFVAPVEYRDEFDELGGRQTWPRASAARIRESADNGAWEGPFATCEERFEAVAANVAALEAQGRTVVVVFMPISGTRAAMFEGGRDEIRSVLDRIEAAVLDAGADAVVDMTTLVPDEHFRDLSHVDEEGARMVTGELVRRLAALGI